MTEVSKEAVEVLICALKQTSWGDLVSADVVLSEIEKRGYAITRAEQAEQNEVKMPLQVRVAIDRLEHYCTPHGNDHADDIRAHIAALEAKITTLRNAAEIGLTYVLAAQSGLTFTKPRMSSDVEVFNDALKMGGDE